MDVEIQMDSLSMPFKNHLEHLQTIPGVNRISSTNILAEIGAEMDKFSTVNHLKIMGGDVSRK
ncbi:IS110 family transposase [Kaistella anthropi]|nr:IS110 family transposase [Kaistella anthropi]